jgi:hypothetical protein
MTDGTLAVKTDERNGLRRQRRWTNRLAAAALLAVLAASAGALEVGTAQHGLKGIFSEQVPAELSAEAFAPLGPNWKEWGEQTAAAIQRFYALEGDAATQRQHLADLKARLAVMEKALQDARYASIHLPLISLHSPLARRVALAEALLDTLEASPQAAHAQRIAAKANAVGAALDALERDVKTFPGGSAWLNYIKADDLRSALTGSPDHEATTGVLNATKSRLAKRETLTDESQKQFLSRPAFLALEAAIAEHLAALAAPLPADNSAALRDELKKLVAALEDYEASASSSAAREARAVWRKVRELAADGGDRLQTVLSTHYFNFNVRIVASEQFLSRLLADARTETGQVRDYILGANVGGWQTTSTTVSVDLKPAADRVRFDLVLNGTVQSNTAGTTSEATVYTSGYHTFVGRKEVSFDGTTFRTQPGTLSVVATNTPTGATTRYSGGLFGRAAERIAMQEAANRRGASEAIARSRIYDRVLPKFNAEVDSAFADSGKRLENELFAGLRATGLYPDAQRYQSTDQSLRLSTRLMAEEELGGGAAPPQLLPEQTGATLALHESVVNNAIDRLELAGKTLTEEELRKHVEQFLSKALAREFKFRAPEAAAAAPASAEQTPEEQEDKTPSKLAFAEQDPLRVQFRNGMLILTIRAGLVREGKEPIPTQQITAPIYFKVEGDKILATRDALEIVGVDGDIRPLERRVMNSKISAALPDRAVSAKFQLQGPKRTVQAQVSRIHMVDGWITVTAN